MINFHSVLGYAVSQTGSQTFLGLKEPKYGPWDIAILPIPLEITTSWKEGTAMGPNACLEVSSQVELYDELLENELPCGLSFHTSIPWSSDEGTLEKQLDSIKEYVKPWTNGKQFPLILGGEHGILLPIIESLSDNSKINYLQDLTIVQIDAHADLRNELNGEKFSHGTVVRRCLDSGVGKVIQIGVRAFNKEEFEIINNDVRVDTWFARDLFGLRNKNKTWAKLLNKIEELRGPIWLTFDIDGLDSSLVPSTGTPMPGGLSYWQAIELIEKLFFADGTEIIGADINEINQGGIDSLTEFNAALIATKIVACQTFLIRAQKD